MDNTITPSTTERKRQSDCARYLRLRTERDATRPQDLIDLLCETELAYLAGLTDGDGSIYVTRTNRLRTVYPAVTWAMTDRPTIDWVTSKIGGRVVVMNNHTNLREGKTTWGRSTFKPQWRAQVAGSRARRLCERMLPYLVTKRAQAELVVQFPCDERRAPGIRLSDEIRATRIELGERISALNHP